MSTPQSRYYQFGSGYVFILPNAPNSLSNIYAPSLPTPVLIGTLQDASLEITTKIEELRGNLQTVEVLAAGDIDIKGKVNFGRFDIDLMNQVQPNLFQSIAAGIDIVDVKEAHTVPASGPYTVTVTNAAAGSPPVTIFDFDLGVTYPSGQKFINQNGGALSAAGQYNVSASGVYTFYSADAGVSVIISYTYKAASVGRTLTLAASLQGSTNYCQLLLDQPFSGNNAILLNNVVFGGFKMMEKRSGFTVPEMDFIAASDANGNVGRWFQGITG